MSTTILGRGEGLRCVKRLTVRRGPAFWQDMKLIETSFEGRADHRDYRFMLVQRQGRIALYEKRAKRTGDWRGGEVVRVRGLAGANMQWKVIEGREALPAFVGWGTGRLSA